MHIKKRPTLNTLSKLYVGISASFFNYDLKRVEVRDLEEHYNGLSANISYQVMLYYDNIVLLRHNKWKASDTSRQSDNWIKLIHV